MPLYHIELLSIIFLSLNSIALNNIVLNASYVSLMHRIIGFVSRCASASFMEMHIPSMQSCGLESLASKFDSDSSPKFEDL